MIYDDINNNLSIKFLKLSISTAEGTMFVEMRLDSRGGFLKNEISKKLGMEQDSFKLICLGQNVEDDLTLEKQNVKVGKLVYIRCKIVYYIY